MRITSLACVRSAAGPKQSIKLILLGRNEIRSGVPKPQERFGTASTEAAGCGAPLFSLVAGGF